MKRGFENIIERLFGLDVRGLALARISFGVLILADLFNRARALSAHYTDAGVLPRWVMDIENVTSPLEWSVHTLGGTAGWQALLFLVAAVFAVMLIFGFKTRIATIMSWVLLVSLQNANPAVLQGGDIAMRTALFWALFVPWGAVLSYDSKSAPPVKTTRLVSVGTFAWIVSVAMIYIGSAALKTDPSWFGVMATAVESALHIDQFATYIGMFARTAFPPLFLIGVTNIFFFLQTIAPFAFFIPSREARVRGIAVALLILMHASFVPFMRLGLFPFVDIAFLIPLLPKKFFDYVWRKFLEQPFRLYQHKIKVLAPSPSRTNSILIEVAAGFFLFLSVIVNVREHSPVRIRLPEGFEHVITLTRLDQRWDMFSPYPLTDDGWYVMPGLLENGTRVDVFDLSHRGGLAKADGEMAVSFEKPRLVSADYKTQRWRKYMMNLWDRDFARLRPAYAAWLCREWNKKHTNDTRLEEVEIVFMREDTDLSNPNPEAKRVSLGVWMCE